MIRLKAKNRHLNLYQLTNALFGSKQDGTDNPFQEVTLQNAVIDEENETINKLNAVIKEINRRDSKACVRQEDDDFYRISVHFEENCLTECKVRLRPLLSRKSEDYGEEILFTGLSITQLSSFYVLSVSDGTQTVERVLMIPTEGLPEKRDKAVVSSVVSNRECFYRYVAFLLGDDAILSVLEANRAANGTGGGDSGHAYRVPALYEKMLQTAAVAPEKFKGLEYLMKAISEDGIIPEDFRKLYETFQKAVKFNG
jgi:hypothetical protein